MATCVQCGGTGKVVLMKSWFPSDGYTKQKCGICGGTGESSFHPDIEFTRHQAELRHVLAAGHRALAADSGEE